MRRDTAVIPKVTSSRFILLLSMVTPVTLTTSSRRLSTDDRKYFIAWKLNCCFFCRMTQGENCTLMQCGRDEKIQIHNRPTFVKFLILTYFQGAAARLFSADSVSVRPTLHIASQCSRRSRKQNLLEVFANRKKTIQTRFHILTCTTNSKSCVHVHCHVPNMFVLLCNAL